MYELSNVVETTLERALVLAAEAKRWDVVTQIVESYGGRGSAQLRSPHRLSGSRVRRGLDRGVRANPGGFALRRKLSGRRIGGPWLGACREPLEVARIEGQKQVGAGALSLDKMQGVVDNARLQPARSARSVAARYLSGRGAITRT